MIRNVLLCFLILAPAVALSQDGDTSQASGWEFEASVNAYFQKDDFTLLPVFKADKDWLHLEARYNYESINTFSAWGGYNFSGGNKLEYSVTPMAGFVIGDADGFAPGLEMTFALGDFELYSESEYFIDPGASVNNFFYMWTDVTYSPLEWLWFGLSGQRTRVYETSLEVQRGILVGGGVKSWELNTYFYNPASDDFYIIGSLLVYF